MITAWNDLTALQNALTVGTDERTLTAVQLDATETSKYEIADVEARQGVVDNRERIDALQLSTHEISVEVDALTSIVQGGVNYRGKTNQDMSDGLTSTTIAMAGGTLEVRAGKGGDMVIVPGDLRSGDLSTNAEFIWDGEKWNEFGTAGDLKALAYKNSASGDYTPAGNVGVSSAGAQNVSVTGSFTASTAFTAVTGYQADSFTPSGTITDIEYTPSGSVALIDDITVTGAKVSINKVSSATFVGDEITVMTGWTPAAFTPSGDVNVSIGDQVVTYTRVSAAGFTGTSITPNANVTSAFGTKTFTGSLAQLPKLSADEVVKNVTSATTNVLANASVVNNVLQFGSAPVLSSIEATKAAAELGYTGTLTAVSEINIETSGEVLSSVGVTIDPFTPSGDISISTGSYTDTVKFEGGEITATFTGTSATITGEAQMSAYTPTGKIGLSSGDYEETVSSFTIGKNDFKLEFTGKAAKLSTEFIGTAAPTLGTLLTATYMPTGSIKGTAEISAHSHDAAFTGTSATITVS